MSAHNEHHYIPKFLLREWHSGEDIKLSQMRWIRGQMTEKRYKSKSVAKERHLYSMARDSEQPNREIEPKFMSHHVDDPAALVHKELLRKNFGGPSDEQRCTWTLFLVSLIFRGPGAIEHVRQSGIDAIHSQFPQGLEHTEGLTAETLELRDLYRRRDPSLLDFGTYALPELIQSSTYNQLLFEGRWSVRHILDSKDAFLIGDRPLVLLGDPSRFDLVFLPLGPKVAFFSSTSPRMTKWINSMNESHLVRRMNRCMVEHASVHVWGSNFDHCKLLELRLARTPAGRGLGIGPRPGS